MFEKYHILVYTIFIITIMAATVYLFSASNGIGDFVNSASDDAKFEPTYMVVYENSDITKGICDRLIVIYPFMWYVLAYFGDVLVVDTINSSYCPRSAYTFVYKVPHTVDGKFIGLCINFDLEDLLTYYSSNCKCYKIPYRVESLQSNANCFTIIDVLNFLFKYYITINVESSTSYLHKVYMKK